MKIKKTFVYPKSNEEATGYMQAKYMKMDAAIASELQQLSQNGITPSCRRGCSHCCRQLVLAAPLEGMALIHFVEHVMIAEQRQRVLERTRAWFKWQQEELPHHMSPGKPDDYSVKASAHYNYGPHCPLLENDACSVYGVRPLACRSHFVSSDPRGCMSDPDPLYMPGVYKPIEIGVGLYPIAQQIRKDGLKNGVDTATDGKLIPEWIASLL